MLFVLILFSGIALVLNAQSYSISISCQACSLPGCTQCVLYNGGPFYNFLQCVQQDQTCFLQNNVPEVISFSCLAPDGNCAYTNSYQQKLYSGTTSPTDSYWPGLQLALNSILQLAQNTTTTPDYNWCTGVGSCSTFSTGAIVGITIGSVAGVGVIVLVAACYCRRKKHRKQKNRPVLITLTAALDQNKNTEFDKQEFVLDP